MPLDIDRLISIWSMRPQPGTPCGNAWEQGARWAAQQAALHEVTESMQQLDAFSALNDVYKVLGPSTPPCCDGCRYEWDEALRILRRALNIQD